MNNAKTIRKDKKLDKRLKRHFKEDLQYNNLTNQQMGSNDEENMPLLTEHAEGGSIDVTNQKQTKQKSHDLENAQKIEQKPHFSSEHSEYDQENDKEGGRKGGDYVEASKCCYCIPLKCALILFTVLVILDFLFECWDTYELLDNTVFDAWYSDVYAGLLVLYLVGIILIFYYWCATDSPSTRAVLPWAFLIASVVNFLFATWLCVYIFALYKKEFVYVQRYTQSSNLDEHSENDKALTSKYKKVSKVEYVLTHLISPVLDGTCFMFVYCTAAGWVDRHKNQEKAHG